MQLRCLDMNYYVEVQVKKNYNREMIDALFVDGADFVNGYNWEVDVNLASDLGAKFAASMKGALLLVNDGLKALDPKISLDVASEELQNLDDEMEIFSVLTYKLANMEEVRESAIIVGGVGCWINRMVINPELRKMGLGSDLLKCLPAMIFDVLHMPVSYIGAYLRPYDAGEFADGGGMGDLLLQDIFKKMDFAQVGKPIQSNVFFKIIRY